jgi:hypothetical protein
MVLKLSVSKEYKNRNSPVLLETINHFHKGQMEKDSLVCPKMFLFVLKKNHELL